MVISLRELRRSRRLTQTELSKRAGICLSELNLIENGKCYPQKETRKKIAAVFHVAPETIFDKPPLFRKKRPTIKLERQVIHCRWCHGEITGLIWNPAQYELIVKRMPRAAKVHTNGFFYHEDCLAEKIRSNIAFPRSPEK